jgi:DNA mismatch repair protein MutS
MTIVKEYLDLTEKYKKEYGEKTLVLMQVGSFFEAYGLLDKDDKIYGSDIVTFAEINEMTISRKNICVGKARVVMAGFGLPQLEKYIRKMQDNGYTIPVYTQDTNSKNTTRSLNSIFSPGTYFSNETRELSNNITSIWIEISNNIITKMREITIGVSNIDIFTGKTSIFEFSKPYGHNPATYDELERYISIYNPNECIIISNLEERDIEDIINYTSINSNKIHKINKQDNIFSKNIVNCEKQIYQKEVIERFYPNQNSENILNHLREYSIASQSFIYLLDFTFRHNPNLVNKITEPIYENYTDRLTLANHSLKQLNMISDTRQDGKYGCVSNLLNNCLTPMGKRSFNYNLLNPTTNIEKLNISYNITEHLLTNGWEDYRTNLSNIRDIEKIKRKLVMKKITPKDFCNLKENIDTTISLYEISKKDKKLVKYFEESTDIKDFTNVYKICVNLKETITNTLNIKIAKFIDDISQERLGNIDILKILYINLELDDKVDKFYKLSLESEKQLEAIKNYFSSLVKRDEKNAKTTEFVKIHETAKNDSTLQSTKRRITFLKRQLDEERKKVNEVTLTYYSNFSEKNETFNLNISDIDFLATTGNQSNMIITNGQIRKICSLINTAKNDLIQSLEMYYYKFMEKVIEIDLECIVNFIRELDILQCKCYLANKYNYNKPVIRETDKSFVNFTGLRHALIEHINTRELYVTNSLDLSDDINGILLYGTNAVGKTSFIKAIGIAIIMAQAGLYVPASLFEYNPYNTIFTRILGHDNIFKGLSTFAVEMIELRTILQFADRNSLILGDELCSGTESDSALSIFVSGLEELHKRESTFLFATHFHEIVNYEEVKNLNKLEMYHMSVIYDKITNKLVYDRKLKKGAGDSMYGLEVCKSLDLPNSFLTRAHDLRIKYNKVYQTILNQDTSKYNSKKLKGGLCEMCKSNLASEIHHLEYQKNAKKNGFINNRDYNFNKDHVANLINICEECHDKIHRENKKLKIKKSSNGYQLVE